MDSPELEEAASGRSEAARVGSRYSGRGFFRSDYGFVVSERALQRPCAFRARSRLVGKRGCSRLADLHGPAAGAADELLLLRRPGEGLVDARLGDRRDDGLALLELAPIEEDVPRQAHELAVRRPGVEGGDEAHALDLELNVRRLVRRGILEVERPVLLTHRREHDLVLAVDHEQDAALDEPGARRELEGVGPTAVHHVDVGLAATEEVRLQKVDRLHLLVAAVVDGVSLDDPLLGHQAAVGEQAVAHHFLELLVTTAGRAALGFLDLLLLALEITLELPFDLPHEPLVALVEELDRGGVGVAGRGEPLVGRLDHFADQALDAREVLAPPAVVEPQGGADGEPRDGGHSAGRHRDRPGGGRVVDDDRAADADDDRDRGGPVDERARGQRVALHREVVQDERLGLLDLRPHLLGGLLLAQRLQFLGRDHLLALGDAGGGGLGLGLGPRFADRGLDRPDAERVVDVDVLLALCFTTRLVCIDLRAHRSAPWGPKAKPLSRNTRFLHQRIHLRRIGKKYRSIPIFLSNPSSCKYGDSKEIFQPICKMSDRRLYHK